GACGGAPRQARRRDLRPRGGAPRGARGGPGGPAVKPGAAAALAACALALGACGGAPGAAPHRSPAAAASGATGGGARWRPYRGPVPILEYHPIQPPIPGSPYPQLFVPQADFTAQMKWLAAHGYTAVTLDRVEAAWYRGGELPPKPVVITFDDGYRSQFVAAFPVLQHFHWPGVLDLKAKGSDLPAADVRRMLGAAALRREIAGSKRELERRFGVPVDNFCYPAGRYDAAAIADLRRAGYRGATTEIYGLADRSHRYTLARIEVEYADRLAGFVRKLRAARPQ